MTGMADSSLFWLDPRKVEEGMEIEIQPIGPIEVIKKFTSYNRLVMLVERADGVQLIIKTFRFKDVPASMMTRENLVFIEHQIQTYKDALRKAGVLTSSGVGFVFHEYNTEPVLVQWERYAGRTCSHDISGLPLAEKDKIFAIVKAILRDCAKPLFDNAPNPYRPEKVIVGLDLNPRNFTWLPDAMGNVRCYSVDLFPGKTCEPISDKYTLEFPEPHDKIVRKLGIERHFNKAGLLVNFWSNLTRVRPELAKDFYLLVEEFLRENGYDRIEKSIDEYLALPGFDFNGYPLDVGKVSQADVIQIISKWTFEEIFKIRLLANALAYWRHQSRHLLEQVFTESHFQNNPLSMDQVNRVKNILLEMADYPVDHTA